MVFSKKEKIRRKIRITQLKEKIALLGTRDKRKRLSIRRSSRAVQRNLKMKLKRIV